MQNVGYARRQAILLKYAAQNSVRKEEQADCCAEDVNTAFTLTGHAEPPLTVDVKLCGKKMWMEIDTGIDINHE